MLKRLKRVSSVLIQFRQIQFRLARALLDPLLISAPKSTGPVLPPRRVSWGSVALPRLAWGCKRRARQHRNGEKKPSEGEERR